MPRMCQVPNCGELACYAIAIEDVKVYTCLQHKQGIEANMASVHAQLAQHEHGTPCQHCAQPATCQLQFGGEWFNQCRSHARSMSVKIRILGREPVFRPLQTFYTQAPAVIVEELPVG